MRAPGIYPLPMGAAVGVPGVFTAPGCVFPLVGAACGDVTNDCRVAPRQRRGDPAPVEFWCSGGRNRATP